MESNLIALKLFLDAVGHSDALTGVEESIGNRLRLQKAVYLGQIWGADLGYRYNWYVKGPYSPSLAQDYYELSGALAADNNEHQKNHLNSRVVEAINKAKPLLQKPEDINLPIENWLELVASIDYLRRVSRQDDKGVETTINSQKPHLAPHFTRGLEHVKSHAPTIR